MNKKAEYRRQEAKKKGEEGKHLAGAHTEMGLSEFALTLLFFFVPILSTCILYSLCSTLFPLLDFLA